MREQDLNLMSPPRRRLKKLLQIGVGIKANSRASECACVCAYEGWEFPLFFGNIFFMYAEAHTLIQ